MARVPPRCILAALLRRHGSRLEGVRAQGRLVGRHIR